jgi:hypothetical protein
MEWSLPPWPLPAHWLPAQQRVVPSPALLLGWGCLRREGDSAEKAKWLFGGPSRLGGVGWALDAPQQPHCHFVGWML